MRIGSHPKVTGQHWPGQFGGSVGASIAPTNIPDGIFKNATVERGFGSSASADYLSIQIDWQGHEVITDLMSDDLNFLDELCVELNTHCQGMTIKDIGNRDVNF